MGTYRVIHRIEKASHRWNGVVGGFAGVIIIVIMMLVVADVSGRYFFNNPITGSLEVGQMMLACVAFLCFAYGLIKGTHVRVTLLFGRLPQRVKLGAEIFAGLVGIAFFILVTWGGIEQFWESWVVKEVMPAAVELPYWLPKLMLPVGAILITIQFLFYILHHLGTLLSKGEER